MTSNLDRYRKDLEALQGRGTVLSLALRRQCFPEKFARQVESAMGKGEADSAAALLPEFWSEYQSWYSEAMALVRQILPDRLADFVGHYEVPKGRKVLDAQTYRIADCVLGYHSENTFGGVVAGPSSAIPHLAAQLAIVKAAAARFDSVLFEIRQLVRADVFDSELDAARELLGHGFARAAGAMAGVVLEHHLTEVCTAHNVAVGKKNPTIADFNETLKSAGVIDVAQWRYIQHLADIRNKCDHKKSADPTPAEVTDLVDGVAKTIKTIH